MHEESIFDYLSREMRRLRYLSDDLPFDFNCGFVGYFGYELKADVEGDLPHQSTMPDAAFIFADRLIAFDHFEKCAYLLCVDRADQRGRGPSAGSPRPPRGSTSLPPLEPVEPRLPPSGELAEFYLSRSHQQYLDDIAAHQGVPDRGRELRGLPHQQGAHRRSRPSRCRSTGRCAGSTRRRSPAYLRFGEAAVLSSSPERFLSVGRDRWVEAKPIKGTPAAAQDRAEDVRLAEELRTDEKTRAENLMITDLLRNDLGVVCEIGTVHVPHLMEIESYETVHQLVSTIRGLLRDDVEPPDCIRACFPGGSMTGAPKKRTMEIIDELEGEARGVYSGAIGYLGLSGGCDLNIVIRTIVMDGETTTIGTGGAIVMQSDDEDEYQEIMLKARALINAMASYAAPGGEIRVHEGESLTAAGELMPAASASVSELLESAASTDGLALVHGDERIGYAELNERVERLAGALAARGIGHGRAGGAHPAERAGLRGRLPRDPARGRRGRPAQPALQGRRARVRTSASAACAP